MSRFSPYRLRVYHHVMLTRARCLHFLQLFFIALIIFLCMDMVWLGVFAKQFYAQQIGNLLKTDVNWAAAGTFYMLFIIGLVALVILPAQEKQRWQSALRMGGLFGLVTYATYDLTNLAVAKDWPLTVTLVDLAWGTFVSAAVATLTTLIAPKLR